MIQPCIYRPFVDLPVWWTPFRIRHIDPLITRFQRNCTQVWQTTVDQLCMPMPSYIKCGWVTEVRARTGNIKSISLMVACIQGPDAGQKCFKISRIFNFGVQLWLTRIRFDLVTAQVDHPIILESTLNDSALYLSAVWRFGRLRDPIQNTTFWPVNYQISTKLSPSLTDYCGSAVHAHAFIYTVWMGDESKGTHRKYKVHILNGCLYTGPRCWSKML